MINKNNAPPKKWRSLTLSLLLLPVLFHVIGMILSLSNTNLFQFGKLDFLILAGMCFYLVAIILLNKKSQLIQKFTILVYSLIIPIISLELFFFMQDKKEYFPWPPMNKVFNVSNTMIGIKGKVHFTVNNRGVRGPSYWPSTSKDRILCIGGSTTECFYVTDKKSWPWLLGIKLSKKLERPILVANAGRSGHFTLHHEHQLLHYNFIDQFDTIIILPGINDAGTFFRNNYKERAASVQNEALINYNNQGVYYRKSFLVKTLKKIFEKRYRASIQQDSRGEWYADERKKRQILMQNKIETIPPELTEALDIYRSNLIKIIKLCSTKKQKLIFLTQPTMYQKNMPNDFESLIWEHTDTGAYTTEVLAEVMSSYNTTLSDICKKYNISCLDLASQMPKDTSVFYDDCHFNENGCNLLANTLFEYMTKNIQHK